MQLKNILSLALATQIAARNLSEALASRNSSLSALNSLLLGSPSIVAALDKASNVTILAPNNNAIQTFLDQSPLGSISRIGSGALEALLSYHVLNGTYYASNITDASHPLFIPASLTNATYANITGGQRVEATVVDGNVTFYSGLRENSSVVTPDTNFTGGTVHIIDRVLTIPQNDTQTLIDSNLAAAAGAMAASHQADNINLERDVTIFAPTNEAFSAVGSAVEHLTSQQLAKLVQYHVVPGTVVYSSDFKNGTLTTLSHGNVTITVRNGTVFVNSARIINSDILVSNGVLHVIDNVLNPMNSTATPAATGTSNPPAFSGASSTSGVPFTSGVPTATTTAPAASRTTTMAKTSSSSAPGVPVRTGAVGAAALFGGAAMLANL